jgi:hypothetical protein
LWCEQYSIYSSIGFSIQNFGSASEFVFSNSDYYTIRERKRTILVYSSIKNSNPFQYKLNFDFERIFDGTLLGISSYYAITFYDW